MDQSIPWQRNVADEAMRLLYRGGIPVYAILFMNDDMAVIAHG